MRIQKLLTDNAGQFTDRFTTKGKKPSGGHVFDRQCAKLGIEHRLIKPRHPQTNARVERFVEYEWSRARRVVVCLFR